MKRRAIRVIRLLSILYWGMLAPSLVTFALATEDDTASVSLLVPSGVSPEAISGLDPEGIPIRCGTASLNEGPRQGTPVTWGPAYALPAGTRSFEAVPSVIRTDGKDSFVLEVNAGGPMASVHLAVNSSLLSESGSSQQQLRDDGAHGDRVANDYVFTSEQLRYNSALGQPGYLYGETNSPAGLSWTSIGSLSLVETNGVTNQFLVAPYIGLLHTNIPSVSVLSLASNLHATPHLLNIQTVDFFGQCALRALVARLEQLTSQVYGTLPDSYDFLVLFTIAHLERLPRLASENFTSGIHMSPQIRFTGSGQSLRDYSAFYGSPGRLQGINILDTLQRGISTQNLTHELIHQWCAFISPTLGLSEDCCHFSFRSSVGSLVGGQRWIDNSNGTFTVDCREGRSGAHYASPLDKYMLGLVEPSNVPPLRAFSSSITSLPCNEVITNIVLTRSVADIQERHGPRIPGPQSAQRSFALGFIAESHERFLNLTEMTYYEILAEHYTRSLPAGSPAPYVGFNWVSISKFFGEATTWSSHHPSLVQARASLLLGPNGRQRISGSGFPGEPYTLEASTNLVYWSSAQTAIAAANGELIFFESPAPEVSTQFYRIRWR